MSDNTATPTALAAANRPADAIVRLDDEVLFRVSGKDPRKFLHGQLTQSLDEVTPAKARRAAACNPKGRAYALMLLAEFEGDFLFSLPTAIAEDVRTQLNKFLMLFRGTAMSVLDDARLYGIWGQQAAASLASEAHTLAQPGDALTLPQGKLIRTQDTAEGCARYEFWQLNGDEITYAGDCASPADWAAAEISAGIIRLTPESQGQFVPQMLNWQHLDGIHFKKGCYTGQEVIARMHYLGQLKKSLFRLGLPSAHPVSDGDTIVADGKTVGEVVNRIAFDDGHQELLAVVKHAALGNEPWTVDGQPATLERLALPYTVPEQSAPAD